MRNCDVTLTNSSFALAGVLSAGEANLAQVNKNYPKKYSRIPSYSSEIMNLSNCWALGRFSEVSPQALSIECITVVCLLATSISISLPDIPRWKSRSPWSQNYDYTRNTVRRVQNARKCPKFSLLNKLVIGQPGLTRTNSLIPPRFPPRFPPLYEYVIFIASTNCKRNPDIQVFHPNIWRSRRGTLILFRK